MTEDEELTWLRSENALLRVERDILLRVASGYAMDHHEYGETPMTTTWLTPEAHRRLQAELAELSTRADPDETVDIAHRRASRAREIQTLLATAVVGEDPPNDGIAEPGMVLTIRYDDTAEEETFLLALRDAEQGELEVYSPISPLGMAITGARRGEQRAYQVPKGATVRVTLLEAVPYGQHQGS